VIKNRTLHCPEKRYHSFCSYISDNFASDLVIFGMLHHNEPSLRVGNEIFFWLTWQCCVEWSNVDHAVVTAAIRHWRRRLSACVQAGGGHFEHHF